eukprot:2111082-Rhodomonas_salina.2
MIGCPRTVSAYLIEDCLLQSVFENHLALRKAKQLLCISKEVPSPLGLLETARIGIAFLLAYTLTRERIILRGEQSRTAKAGHHEAFSSVQPDRQLHTRRIQCCPCLTLRADQNAVLGFASLPWGSVRRACAPQFLGKSSICASWPDVLKT